MYAFTAALLAQYADSPGSPLKAARLETASRCPLPRASMPGSTASIE